MKFAATATTLAVAAILVINGAIAAPDAAPAAVSATTASNVISPQEAFEAVKSMDLPAGVTLTGSVEPIKEPANTVAAAKKTEADHDDNKEWFGGALGYGGFGGFGGWGGIGGIGGWGGRGGWGGFGPYRFGFNCGGLGGWAYPLGFWNTFGAGLYGGGCGLGIPFGGLFYC